jgi:hypothetical protein
MSVENCQFEGYARNSDMYKADIVFADRSSSLQVRMSLKIFVKWYADRLSGQGESVQSPP